MSGAELIRRERVRQKRARAEGGEGYNRQHDRGHADELARAGATYALTPEWRSPPGQETPGMWPWQRRYWKPTPSDRVRELVKAGALIAAAIDSLQAER